MKYNLARYSHTEDNTVEGNVSLTTDEIISIITTVSASISLTTGDVLCLDCDLGARMTIDQIKYFYSSAVSSGTVTNEVEMYYKEESFENYTSLDTMIGSSFYYASISGTIPIARYIRLKHSVTSSGGDIQGFQITNYDDIVDFGQSGTDESVLFAMDLENNTTEIQTLYVYNNGSVQSDAKILIEPQNTAIDDALYISDNEAGPWYGIYQDSDMITGDGLWESGNYSNLEITANILKLSPGQTTGTYTTRIIETESAQRLTHLMLPYDYPTASGSSIIAVDVTDTTETIEVRSSNYKPLDRDTYIQIYDNGGTASIRNRWVEDGTIESSGPNLSDDWGSTSEYWEIFMDSISEDYYIVLKPFSTGGNTALRLAIQRKAGSYHESTIYAADYDDYLNYNTYKITPNYTGGFWIYYYLNNDNGDYDSTAFRLYYYDSGLGSIYSRTQTESQGTFIYDMESPYNSTDLWYTNNDNSSIIKINTSGSTVASYIGTELVRGLTALSDGGCWVIQGDALVHLNTDADLVESITLGTDTASYVKNDYGTGFYIQDGWYIKRIDLNGNLDFEIEIPNLIFFDVINSGFIAKAHDGSDSVAPKSYYVSKYYKRIIRQWDYPQNENNRKGTFAYSRYGVRSHKFDDTTDDHASNFPITIDDQWTSVAEWKKVSLRDFHLSNEQHHQFRITLRADSSDLSPLINGFFTQHAIEIPGILPNNYGTFYLKTDVSNINVSDTGTYNSNVRAWWYITE